MQTEPLALPLLVPRGDRQNVYIKSGEHESSLKIDVLYTPGEGRLSTAPLPVSCHGGV